MKNSFLRYFFNRVHLAYFDVGVRKLMLEWQACSHRILIAAINRISSTIDLEDKELIRETVMRRDPIFHETPHQSSPETRMLGRRSQRSRVLVNFVLIWLQLPRRCGI
jgi:hypothetical protein